METASYFLRYLPPIGLSCLSVALLAVINHVLGRFVSDKIAEPMEVLGYSIMVAGPFAFSLSFLFFFYLIASFREGESFAKTVALIVAVLIIVGFVLDILYLPKMKH